MTNQQDDQSHIPIVLQTALAAERKPTTMAGLLPKIPESCPQASVPAQMRARESTIYPYPAVVQEMPPVRVNNRTLESRVTIGAPNSSPQTNVNANPARYHRAPCQSGQQARPTGHESQNPTIVSPFAGHLYGARDPTSIYGTPQFANQAAGINFASPSTYQRYDPNHCSRRMIDDHRFVNPQDISNNHQSYDAPIAAQTAKTLSSNERGRT
ncbi:unnamed protein product [Cochlearia groenlandica]